MTLQELRYLVALADKGHFVRAAEACNVGQPTLSTQLKKLEDYLGVTLFERNKHHLGPTPIGEQIIERARLALEVVEQIRGLALRGSRSDERAAAAGRDPDARPLPDTAPAARAARAAVRSCACCCARTSPPTCWSGCARAGSTPCCSRCRCAATTSRCWRCSARPSSWRCPGPCAGRARPRSARQTSADENVLLLEEGHCMREQALAMCGGQPSDEREELKATSIETLRQMVAAGVGCTLLPQAGRDAGRGLDPATGMVQIRPFAAARAHAHHRPGVAASLPARGGDQGLAELILANLPPAAVTLAADDKRVETGHALHHRTWEAAT